MLELITQYGPYLFLVLAAFFLFAVGHHVGSSTAATSAPAAITATTVAPAATVLSNVGEDGRVELSLVPIESKKEDAPTRARALADAAVAHDPAAALSVHQTLTESLTVAGHFNVKGGDSLDKILPTKETLSAPIADIQAAIAAAPAVVSDASPVTKLDAEVAKAHDALDKAGVFGPNRLIAIAAVRAGQVTGEDVARAHPVIQELQPVPQAPAQQ